MIDWDRFVLFLVDQVGTSYKFGAEAKVGDPRPGALDCSELVEMAYGYIHIKVPDGSDNQYRASTPIPKGLERLGDVGFFKKKDRPCHHVGILYDNRIVIEARGIPYNRVIIRPRSAWEAWREFSGWRRFNAVTEAEKETGKENT